MTAYELARLLSIVATVWLTVLLNRRQRIPAYVTLTISALGVVAGQVGSRLLDMLEYARSFTVGDLIGNGSSSIFGGLMLSFAVVAAGAAFLRVSLGRFLDGAAPALALAEAITRVGCFLAGCCYGIASAGPLAVSFPPQSLAFMDQVSHGLLAPDAPGSLPVHPVQLYSAGAALLITLLLLAFLRRRHHDGDVFCAFLVAYGGLRLLVAPLRVEKLRSMVVFSVVFILFGAIGLARHRIRGLSGDSRRSLSGAS